MSHLKGSLRIVLALVGFASAAAGWPILTGIAIVLLCVRYRAYEAPFIGLLTDLLWQSPWHIPYFTIGALIALWVFEPLRTEFMN